MPFTCSILFGSLGTTSSPERVEKLVLAELAANNEPFLKEALPRPAVADTVLGVLHDTPRLPSTARTPPGQVLKVVKHIWRESEIHAAAATVATGCKIERRAKNTAVSMISCGRVHISAWKIIHIAAEAQQGDRKRRIEGGTRRCVWDDESVNHSQLCEASSKELVSYYAQLRGLKVAAARWLLPASDVQVRLRAMTLCTVPCNKLGGCRHCWCMVTVLNFSGNERPCPHALAAWARDC